jgi:hypothetical protein
MQSDLLLEHTFRLFKQVLGWTTPKIRGPHAADRWTWLIITAHAQLRLARPLADDLRLPWERPAPPAYPRPRQQGVSEHPRGHALPGQRAETRQTRPRPPARIKEPPPRTPPRRGKNHQKSTHPQGHARTRRLNDKLSGLSSWPGEARMREIQSLSHSRLIAGWHDRNDGRN